MISLSFLSRHFLNFMQSLFDAIALCYGTERSKAEALRIYLKQQDGSLTMQNQAAEIKLRAERQAGKLLSDVPRKPRIDNITPKSQDVTSENHTYQKTLEENGINRMTAHRWQMVANEISEDEFDTFIETTKAKKVLSPMPLPVR